MELSQIDYYNFLAIRNNYLKPLNKFMSNDEIYLVINKYIFNKKFFPIPFFLTASLDDLKSIKNSTFLVKYKKESYNLPVLSVSTFDKKGIIKELFKGNKFHPYIDIIMHSKEYIIETDDISTKNFKKYVPKKNLVGFATRNIPHKGHEKIIFEKIKKLKVLIIINSEVTKNKKTNINKTLKAYSKFIKREKINNKIILKKVLIPSTMLGYRQAALHAMLGKNFGCDNFIIGRDHSGFLDFYKEFESYDFCKKNEKKIGLNILESGSPLFCKICQKVVFRGECNCKKNQFDISSIFVRKIKNKKLKKIIFNF